jgi:hypothetical protein
MKPRHASSTRRSPEKLRAREDVLFTELCQRHGYAFADTLPARDRSTMLAAREGGRLRFEGGVVLKLLVPMDSALGRRIVAWREEKKAAKGK